MWGSASNPFSVHQKIEKPKMLKMKFWTSEKLVKRCSKRPRDPHNRIRLEKLCPKVVSDRKMAGRMSSKGRFRDFRPIHENPALNVNDSSADRPLEIGILRWLWRLGRHNHLKMPIAHALSVTGPQFEYSDPNPELFKHPMSLSASPSPRRST